MPDIFRTIGNVTMDVAVTTAIATRAGKGASTSEVDAILRG